MSSLTFEQIALLTEFGEADAWANFYLCAPPEFAEKYKLEAKRIGSVWVTMLPEMDVPFFNRIVGLGVGESATESQLDDAVNILQTAGVKNYMAQICPTAQPAHLAEWLKSRGFMKSYNWAKLYRGNEPAPSISTDLRIEQIGREYADAFAEVALTAFEMPSELHPMLVGNIGKPGWHHYLGFDGEQPVTASAMYVRNDTGWLGFGSTLASHRKRGGQGAMFARRIDDGIKLGCKWFVTETGEDTPGNPNPSYHNMIRTGFKLAYQRPNYVHQSPVS